MKAPKFLNCYKLLILAIVAITTSLNTFSQGIYYVKPGAPGYQYSRVQVDSALKFPKRYNLKTEDSSSVALDKGFMIFWDGVQWDTVKAKGVSGNFDSLGGHPASYYAPITSTISGKPLNSNLSSLSQGLWTILSGSGVYNGSVPVSSNVDTAAAAAYLLRRKDSTDSYVTPTAVSSRWKQGGNSFGANGIIGTNDNFPFIHYQNGVERARFAATTGRYLVNTTTDNGTDQVQVNGSILASNFRSISSGLGQVSNTNWFTQRTEGGQTWSLALGTNLDLSNARYATITAANAGYLIITAPAIQLNGEVTTTTSYLLSTTATDFYKKNNTPIAFRQKAISGNRIQGLQFYSEATATNRPNPLTDPVFQVDAEGRTQVGDGTTNYGAALNVISNYGAFLPPRLTTTQRDSISGVIDIVMTNPGTGYTSTPSVSITGGGGSGATGVAILSGNGILGVTIISKGIGYTSAPTVTFSGGGGTGATAVAHQGTLEAGMIIYNKTTNKHQGYNGTSWNDLY